MYAILTTTGIVEGEYGLAEEYQHRREQLTPWLEDEDEKVRSFAESFLSDLDKLIEDERKRVEEDIEIQKHQFRKQTRGKTMNENFHYFALNYLNDWLNIDRPLFERLNSQCAQTGRKALVNIAKEYRVIRCFRRKYEKDNDRLGPVYGRLQKVSRPKSQKSAIETVNKLESKLREFYGQKT